MCQCIFTGSAPAKKSGSGSTTLLLILSSFYTDIKTKPSFKMVPAPVLTKNETKTKPSF